VCWAVSSRTREGNGEDSRGLDVGVNIPRGLNDQG
jgi:hypothetical protein